MGFQSALETQKPKGHCPLNSCQGVAPGPPSLGHWLKCPLRSESLLFEKLRIFKTSLLLLCPLHVCFNNTMWMKNLTICLCNNSEKLVQILLESSQQIVIGYEFVLAKFRWKRPFQLTKICDLTLKRLGGGPKRPPPWHFARLLCNAQSSRRDTLWLFSFKFPAHFYTKFVTPGGTVLKLRNFLYMHFGPKMAPKCDFVYKINANWVFFHIVHINMLIFTLNGWNDFVLALLCFKKCLPQISPKKTTKTKGQKTKKYIRNS